MTVDERGGIAVGQSMEVPVDCRLYRTVPWSTVSWIYIYSTVRYCSGGRAYSAAVHRSSTSFDQLYLLVCFHLSNLYSRVNQTRSMRAIVLRDSMRWQRTPTPTHLHLHTGTYRYIPVHILRLRCAAEEILLWIGILPSPSIRQNK